MKFTINRNIFIKYLSDVQRAISSKTAIPILTGLKLVVTNDSLSLIGSDSNISIEKIILIDATSQLTIEQTGSIVLPSRFFSEIIKRLAGDTVSISLLDQNKVEIKSGKSVFTINGIDASEYPLIEHVESHDNNTISLSAFLLKNVLAQTIIAASTNEQKPIFTGIHLTIQGQTLTAIATDTHRMSKRIIKLPNVSADMTFNCTIPAKSLNELSKIVSDEEELSIVFSENKILFMTKDMYFYSRLLEGSYPDVARLLKQEMTTHLTLDATNFLHAVDRVSLLSNESRIDYITLNIKQNQYVLFSESSEIGYVEENINVQQFEGEPVKISFNPNYMKDALRVLTNQTITIKFLDGGRPFTLTDANDKENQFIQLITPVRTRV